MLTIGSLFSGIGGLELGLEWAGLGPAIWQAESDPFCRSVLERHWPGVRRYHDVRDVDGLVERPGLLCGGFPCQDVSSAGKGAGLVGERSGLWREFARVTRELRPRWVVVENVASGATRWVDQVAGELEELGYEALPVPLSAADVGAPHLRRRVFVVARYAHGDREPAVPVDGQMARVQRAAGIAPNANGARLQGSISAPGPGARSLVAGSPWADHAIPESALRRVDDGLPARVDRNQRLKALGNAVVPQCAEVIGWVIRELDGCP